MFSYKNKQPYKKTYRRLTLMWVFLILSGIALLSWQQGLTNNIPTLSSLIPRQTVIYAYAAEAQTLDPALARDPQSAKIICCIFEGLVRCKPGTTEIEPALATDWKVSANAQEYTFKLRKNIKFHDGSPFNARAVKYSIERQLNATRQNYYTSLVFGSLREVQVIDDYTVKLLLNKPYASLLQNLAMPFAAPIVSPQAAAKYGSAFGVKPVGTGPYIFREWDKGNTITLSVNPFYWEQGPEIKNLIFKVSPWAGKRLAGLIKGNIQLADGFTPQHIDMLKQKKIPFRTAVSTDISYLGFFVNKAPFNNPKLRQAVSMALNRRLLAEYGHPDIPLAQSILPPGITGFDQNLKPYPYNPEKAKKLLREAGYPQGMEINLITYLEQRPYNTTGGEILARSIQKELALVDIKVYIKTYPWDKYKKALNRQEGDAFLFGWISDSGDPDDFLYRQFGHKKDPHGLNISHYHNPQVDVLLEQARQYTAPQLRSQIYSRIQQILLQDAPWIPINHSLHIVGVSPALKGCIIQRNGTCFLNRLH